MKFVHDRKNWELILEARDNRNKIKKFLNNDGVINWAHELDNNYAMWIVNTFKDELIKTLEDEGAFQKNRSDGNVWTKQDVLRLIKQGDDVDEEKESKQDRKLYQVISLYYERLMNRLGSKYRYVIDWTRGRMRDANERVNLKGINLNQAWAKSDEWHKALAEGEHVIIDEEGEIIMTFKDDFYWIDLQTDSCSVEGKAMGHCGSTAYGTTLYSLRRAKKPFVTIAFNEGDMTITQAKGRGNEKPIEKYHPYIVDLLINSEIGIEGFDYEYNPAEDFQISDLNDELFDKLYNGNKKIFENSKGYITLILLSRGLIEKKDATEGLTDITYDEETDDLYILFKDFSEVSELVFNSNTKEFAYNILSHDYDALYFSHYEKFDFKSDWTYLNINTLNKIKEKIISDQDGSFYDEEGNEREFTFTEDNLIVDTFINVQKILNPEKNNWNVAKLEKNNIGGMYFKMGDELFNMADVLKENKDYSYMEEIVDNLNRAKNDADRCSIEYQWFDKVSEMVIDKITNSSDTNDKNRFKFFNNNEMLGLRLNPKYIISIMDDDNEGESFNYDSIEDILNYVEVDDFKIDHIDEHGIWGDVEEEINDAVQNVIEF